MSDDERSQFLRSAARAIYQRELVLTTLRLVEEPGATIQDEQLHALLRDRRQSLDRLERAAAAVTASMPPTRSALLELQAALLAFRAKAFPAAAAENQDQKPE